MLRVAYWLVLLVAATALNPVYSEDYPVRPLRLVVGIAAGGGIDIVSRAVAAPLSDALHQPIVIDNRPGAGNLVAVKIVQHAPADGYTLLMGTIASHGINPVLRREIGYDPVRDFSPIGMVAVTENVLIVNPAFPAKTVADFVNYVKANPDKVLYASPGVGSSIHLTMELFMMQTKTKMVHVPYKGLLQTPILSGEVQAACANLASSLPFIRSGKLRALAVSSNARNSHLPSVPTFAEAGVPLDVVVWYAMFAPAQTPKLIVQTLNKQLAQALKTPEVVDRLSKLGFTARESTPDELNVWVHSELKRWREVVRAANIRVD